MQSFFMRSTQVGLKSPWTKIDKRFNDRFKVEIIDKKLISKLQYEKYLIQYGNCLVGCMYYSF